ncbi:type II toxin-antitoxin system RelE/ParE family toxin [Nitratireductor sp. XY-223]|uniref:type II toxin-antitoxin system RelE/ParE family toxin n=1 Tax=Nitratireductor sp. XY-223 TaxID=2561926 RepID=UPI0010AB3315|nr:type II toxin-antitoxin system RelE/ParE family toxin [Nitratireductor sp. XY-223]
MSKTYRLTPAALADLEKIADYTLEQWGPAKMEAYVTELTERCVWLADHPLMGKARTDIHPDYRCYPQGRHLIFYVIEGDAVTVIRIPHQSMDVESYFGI